MEVFTYDYNGFSISFDFGNGNKMINATEMAKAFGKRASKFLELHSIVEYIEVLESKSNVRQAVITRRGNSKMSGTWMHKTLALRFAQWLSPDFAVWVDEKIEELLTKGSTFIQPLSKLQWIDIARAAEVERLRIEEVNKNLAPKAAYTEKVLTSESSWTITTIAKELGMSGMKLNKILNEKGIQYKRDGSWVLYAKYQNEKYTKTRTHAYEDSTETTKTRINTVWTEKGRLFIHSLFSAELAA